VTNPKSNVNKNINKHVNNKMSPVLTLKDKVFREFLKNSNFGPSEMTKHLNANYNSVKAAFAKLTEEGLIKRLERGIYEPCFSGIIFNLILRIEEIEKKLVENKL
jgi:hypothetical protein